MIAGVNSVWLTPSWAGVGSFRFYRRRFVAGYAAFFVGVQTLITTVQGTTVKAILLTARGGGLKAQWRGG